MEVIDVPEGFRMTDIGLMPEKWSQTTLGELFNIQQGITLSREKVPGKYLKPFLRTANVLWGRLDLTKVDKMYFSDGEIERLTLQAGDLLVCEGGEIGRTAVWHGEIKQCCHQNHVHRLRPKHLNLEPKFYMYWMQAAFLLLGLYRGIGNRTTIPNLSKARLSHFTVPLPPLPEQKQIAYVLSTIQQAKEKTEAVINATKELKKSMMKHLFTYGPVSVEEAENVVLKETDIGFIPEEWNVVEFQMLMNNGTQNGIYKPKKYYGKGVPIVDMKDIFSSDIMKPEKLEKMELSPEEIRKYSLNEGDLLFARRSFKPSGSGKCQIVEKTYESIVFSSSIIRVSLRKDKTCSRYYFYFFSSQLGRKLMGRIIRHLAVSGITGSDLKLLLVPQISLDKQKETVQILSTIDKKIEIEQIRKRALEELFRTLLHNLMTGRIRVTHMEVPHG